MGSILKISSFKSVSGTEPLSKSETAVRSTFEHFCSVRKVDGDKYAVLVSVASSNRTHIQQSRTDIIDWGIHSHSKRHQLDQPRAGLYAVCACFHVDVAKFVLTAHTAAYYVRGNTTHWAGL